PVALPILRLHAHPELGIGAADLATGRRAGVAVRVRAGRARLRRALPARRVAALVALIRAWTDLAAVVLVAHPLPVAPCRRARVAVAVRTRRAVRRKHVRLHAHPDLAIGAADLATGRRARVAVRVRAGRARLLPTPPLFRSAALVALIRAWTDLAAVVLVAHPLPVAAGRRARVAVAVRARRAVRRKHVRLHAHPELGIGAADLATGRRARVAVRVRAGRARLRRRSEERRVGTEWRL